MKTHTDTPPRTPMEVYKMLPEGTLAELIDNVLFMSPSPISLHQVVLNEINIQLFQFFRKKNNGMVYIAPLDVFLDESRNAVQPDIIVLLKENFHLLKEDGYIHGVPDLLIEILSKGNQDYDRTVKRELYRRFGVKEYWIIDPETKLAVGYALESGQYKCIAEDAGLIKTPLLQASFTF